jgi:hypothetical protein
VTGEMDLIRKNLQGNRFITEITQNARHRLKMLKTENTEETILQSPEILGVEEQVNVKTYLQRSLSLTTKREAQVGSHGS